MLYRSVDTLAARLTEAGKFTPLRKERYFSSAFLLWTQKGNLYR